MANEASNMILSTGFLLDRFVGLEEMHERIRLAASKVAGRRGVHHGTLELLSQQHGISL